MHLHEVSDRLIIGGAPLAEDLPRLVNAGVRSIIDLRGDGEPRPQGLPPWEEAELARRAGLAYRQEPVEPPSLSDGLGHAVRRLVAEGTPRVLLHCTTGRRATVFGLLVLACEHALTVDECLQRGRSLGLEFNTMPRLTTFLRHYIERHGRWYQNAARAFTRPLRDYQV